MTWENVTMRKKGQFLSLVIPGLAERRPSLVHGDFMFVKLACEDARDETSPYQPDLSLVVILLTSLRHSQRTCRFVFLTNVLYIILLGERLHYASCLVSNWVKLE
ncbi:hypothetical protein ACOSQ2_027456 [Xanthoceras sorbifolium]